MTGSPSTSSRRAPPRSAHVISAPLPRSRGTPGTSSTHCSSSSSKRDVGGAAVGVDVEDQQPALVADWTVTSRPPSDQCDVGEVLEAGPVPLDVDDASVEPDEVEGDVGVGRAGTGIGQLGRLGGRVGGVGEVPALDGPGVDSGDGEALAVGTPPVPAEAVHLLGGDEVGAAPRDRSGSSASPPASTRQRPSSSPTQSSRPLT